MATDTVTQETKTYLLSQFESIGDDLRRLRERDQAATLQIKDLEKKLSQAEQWVRRLREKCEVLEKKPAVLDGIDEEWLWENRATIEFRRKLSGNRACEIRVHGREVALVTDRVERPEKNMLRRALNEASGRDKK